MKTDNELIAEFMGIAVRPGPGVLYPCDEDGIIDYKNVEPYWPDKDWNQLMPVVEKIGEIDEEWLKENASPESPINVMMSTSIFDGISITYWRVVEFIKWHNENKK